MNAINRTTGELAKAVGVSEDGRMARIIAVMGVAGCGKSTVGQSLAVRLGIAFQDGDALHSIENIEKMARGEPLTAADREPWLKRVEEWMDELLASGASGVLACSALRRAYRDELREGRPVKLVFLRVSRDVAAARLRTRTGHFFREDLLNSQFDALEEPQPDEGVRVIDATLPVDVVVDQLSDL
jgi:gluconokinase